MDTPRLHIQLLGDFRLWSSCGTVIETGWRRKPASLVKLLALAPNHRLHDERAIEMLWPDLPEGAARNNLHQTLHLARHAFVPDRFLRFKERAPTHSRFLYGHLGTMREQRPRDWQQSCDQPVHSWETRHDPD